MEELATHQADPVQYKDAPYQDPTTVFTGLRWQVSNGDPDNPVKPGWTFVTQMIWQNYADATHHLRISDGKGVTIFECNGNSNKDPIYYSTGSGQVAIYNLTVDHMDSGLLIIEVI